MAIDQDELPFLQSANMPTDDVSSSGGPINPLGLVTFSPLQANDGVGVVSDNGADTTQVVTIRGRAPSGVIVTEQLTLNGVTRVPGATVFERILSMSFSAAASGNVVISRNVGGAVLVTVPAGYTSVRRMFDGAVNGATPKNYYEKIFIKNLDGVLALTEAKVSIAADPTAKVTFALAPTKDDAGVVGNRLTPPVGLTFLEEPNTQDVPSGSLSPGEAIGVWLRFQLLPSDGALKSSVTLRINGAST